MRRREFLLGFGASAMLRPWGQTSTIDSQPFTAPPTGPGWRTFDVRVRVAVQGASGPTRVWLPLPLERDTPWQRNLGHRWTGNATQQSVVRDAASGAAIYAATFDEGDPAVDLTMRVATRDVAVNLERRSFQPREDLARSLKPTRFIPTDGIVRRQAFEITAGHRTELGRARAIYDWIVEHTFRDPAVRGCGLGDIRWMLETKNLGGKCADLNALFVGLARASGLPARDLYGLRVAPSARWPSLGRAGGDLTTAQHCRAEVYLSDFGWVPVDPADVRKVILEERPTASASDPEVKQVRDGLFGQWEMNWIAFNDAHDLALPGSIGKPMPFFMYPMAETAGERKDPLDPERFRYTIEGSDVDNRLR